MAFPASPAPFPLSVPGGHIAYCKKMKTVNEDCSWAFPTLPRWPSSAWPVPGAAVGTLALPSLPKAPLSTHCEITAPSTRMAHASPPSHTAPQGVAVPSVSPHLGRNILT